MKIRCRSCNQLVESSEEWGSGPFVCPQCRGSQAAVSPFNQDSAKQISAPGPTGDLLELLAKYQRTSMAIGVLMLILGGIFVVVMPIALMSAIDTASWGVAAIHIAIILALCIGFLTTGILSVQRRPGVHKVSGPVGLLMTLGGLIDLPSTLNRDFSRIVAELAVVLAVLAIGVGGVYCLVQARKLRAAGIDPRTKRR